VECELEVNSPENGNAGIVGEQAPSRQIPSTIDTSADEEQGYSVIPDDPTSQRTSDSATPVYQLGSRLYYEGLVVAPDEEPLQRSVLAPFSVHDKLNQRGLRGCKAETQGPYMKRSIFKPARNTL